MVFSVWNRNGTGSDRCCDEESDGDAPGPDPRTRYYSCSSCSWAADWGTSWGTSARPTPQTDQAHATWHTTRHHIAIAVRDLTVIRRELRADNRTIEVVARPSPKTQPRSRRSGRVGPGSGQRRATGTTIAGLQACLGGVEQALNALSVGDLDQAVSHLSAVATPCQQVAAGG